MKSFFCWILMTTTFASAFTTNKLHHKTTRLSAFAQQNQEPISQLFTDIKADNVERIVLSNDLKKVYYKGYDQAVPPHTVESAPELADRIIGEADDHHIATYISQDPGFVTNTLQVFASGIDFVFVSLLLISVIRMFTGKGQMNQGISAMFPRTNAPQKVDRESLAKTNITLASWAGSPEIFEECTEIVSYLKNATTYEAAGAEIPKGILLEGPPGTGKTLLARAIAAETDAAFFAVSASEFIELYVGLGAARIRTLFQQARANAPAILFIDEIDSIGRQRGAGVNMGNDEREQTLNQLLAEMDGFQGNQGVLVIAATNRKDVLDAALLRPGRFDRIVQVPLPDTASRLAILKSYAYQKLMAPYIDYDLLSEMTAGFSGAQIKNLINEAAILAARDGRMIIEMDDLEKALDKLIVGIAKRVESRSDAVVERVAIHELGHAILASQFFDLQKVTIQATYSGAGGYTQYREPLETTEGGLYTKDLLKKRITVAMGGKAAEYVFYGGDHISSGAIQDLKQANSIAQRMVGNFGMGDELEVFYNEGLESSRTPFLGRSLAMGDGYSEATKEKLDRESLQIVRDAYCEAVRILTDESVRLERMKNVLVHRRTMSGTEFRELWASFYNSSVF